MLRSFLAGVITLCIMLSFPSCAKIFGGGSGKGFDLVVNPGGNSTGGSNGQQGGNSPGKKPGGNSPGFGGGAPSPGTPGGPGWSGPGWGNQPGGGSGTGPGSGPGQGFNPGELPPGIGQDGKLAQDEFYDPKLGVRFRCLAQKCFIRRFSEKDSSGRNVQFGIKVYSEAGMANGNEFLKIERIFAVGGQSIGKLSYGLLPQFLQRFYPTQKWSASNQLNGIPGYYSEYDESGAQLEEFFFADEQEGVVRTTFKIANDQTDDAYLGYFVLYSMQIDLTGPQLMSLKFLGDVKQGETATLEIKAEDDLTGLDLLWSYQESPERKMGDLLPKYFTSWIGYDEAHDVNTYSRAYAFPLVQRESERAWTKGLEPNQYLYSFRIPDYAKLGEIVLGGLSLRDEYGHEVRISLDHLGKEYRAPYQVLKGSVDSALLVRPVRARILPGSGLEDTGPAQILNLEFSPIAVDKNTKELCLKTQFFDVSMARRIFFELGSQANLLPPIQGCLDESTASFTRGEEFISACFQLAGCFGSDGTSKLPKGRISLKKLVLFDEAGNRGELESGGGVPMPGFVVR